MNLTAGDQVLHIAYVQGPNVDHVWPKLYEMVAPACDETLSPANVYEAIRQHQALAWLIEEDSTIHAAAVTRICNARGSRWIEVMTLGRAEDAPHGGFARWSGLLQTSLEQHMTDEGADFIKCYARRGLARWLRELGWRERQVIMEWKA